MKLYRIAAFCATAAFNLASPLLAQSIDGIYQPSGESWTCSADQIGMDGGALAIQNGVISGVENQCNLTQPIVTSNGTRFVAICSAEGTTYKEPITIAPTANGVKIDRDGYSFYWERCNKAGAYNASAAPSNGRWTFGGGQGIYESATQDRYGNSVIFSCNDLGEGGRLRINLGGLPISNGPVDIDIDGIKFGMISHSGNGLLATDCKACGQNYMAIWEAAAAGNLMKITASDGRFAAFSLKGSRDALGYRPCRPANWF